MFLYFCFYTFSELLARLFKKNKSRWDDILVITIALFIYLLSFSHNFIERTQIGTDLFSLLGMKYWRFYFFFCAGILIKKYFDHFIELTDKGISMSLIIICFFFMVFFSDYIQWTWWKPIRLILYGLLGIIIVFTFFRKYQDSFTADKKLGYYLQYIGRRTLDVYLIHYFFLPTHLDFLGLFFRDYNNPTIELFITIIIALMVIIVSIIISNIIRLSPQLSHWLLGTKKQVL